MPFQNGVFRRLYSWVADQAAGKQISAVEFDGDGADVAAALTDCILRDGTGAPTADIPFSGHSLTGLRPAVANGEAVEYAQWMAGGRLVGEIIDFGGSTAPARWLICDGRAVSRTTYALLFATVGAAFGAGDGSTTFNLPDLRGRATFGLDTMSGTSATSSTAAGRVTSAISGVDGTTLGASGGDQRLQAHKHTTVDHIVTYIVSAFSGSSAGGTGSGNNAQLSDLNTAITGAGASQNMPPALMVAKIIYAGV